MELSQLQYAVTLAETKNFSKAAERLFITQPALSQQISALEQELGVKLFTRTTRKVELTENGVEFAASAQKIIQDVQALKQNMALHHREMSGTLNIGLLITLSHLNILQYVNGFREIYPNIQINLQVGWSSDLVNKVNSRELDVAITNIYYPHGSKPDPNLNVNVFLEDSIVAVASKKRQLQTPLTLESLSGVPFVAMEKNTSIRMEMEELFSHITPPPLITCVCPNMESLIAMTRADLGITFLSSGIAEHYPDDDLVNIPLSPVYRTRTAMVTRASRNEPSLAQHLFEQYFYGITY